MGVSFNESVFSAGLDFGLALTHFKSDPDVELIRLIQPKAGLHIIVDGLWSNPYVAPFVKMGASKMDFKNPSPSDLKEIKTNVSLSFGGGIMASMDWFQKTLAMDAYLGYGLDTSYFVLEYEFFPNIKPQKNSIPEMSQSLIKAGFQLVF